MKPFIKWAGSKTQLIPYLIEMLPDNYDTYYEPFLGSGALYFYLSPKKAVLNDCNNQLMNTYRVIRDNPLDLMEELDKLSLTHCEYQYYSVRNMYNKMINYNLPTVGQSSRFIYLNKAGYNGLYRTNSKGLFNVPSAKLNKVNLYDRENIIEISNQLNKDVELITGDFEDACIICNAADFVFFDSPYLNTFNNYSSDGFSEHDQFRLWELFVKLTEKKVYCMLTNSNEDKIRELYSNFNIRVVDVKRNINCNCKNRTGKELIITNY